MGNSLIIRIGAKANEFEKELKRLQGQTKSFEKGLAKTAKISAVAFAGLATAVGVAVKKFTDFERSFTNVQTLLDKTSFKTKSFTKGINDLKNGVLSLGAESGESFEVLNQGLFDIVSSGIEAEKSIQVLTTATELAAAGATDTSTAVDGLTSAINAYGLSAEDSAEVAQKFFLAQKGGKTTVAELSKGFGTVAASAQAFGITLDELLASVSAVTLGGVKTRSAYTGLNAVLANISAPTEAAAIEAKRLGVAFDSQALRAQGLKGFMDSLTTSANFNQQSLEKLFGSVEAKKFVFALAGTQAKAFASQLENLSDKTKLAITFQEALAVKQATIDKATKRATQAFNSLAIQLGERFVPLINKVAGGLSSIAKEFNDMTDEQKDSVATFIKWGLAITAGVTTLTTLALVFVKMSALITATSVAFAAGVPIATAFWVALTGPVGIAVAGILAAGAAITGVVSALRGVSKANQDAKQNQTIEEINKKLDKQLQIKAELAAQSDADPRFAKFANDRISRIDDEITELEKLRQARLEASEGYGTGELLVRPKSDGTDVMAGIDDMLGTRPPVEIPFKPVLSEEEQKSQDSADAEVAALKKIENDKAAIVKAAADKIVADKAAAKAKLLQNAADEQAILKAQNENKAAEEIEFLQRKQALRDEAAEVAKTKDSEVKAAEVENLKLKNELLAAEEKEFYLLQAEEKAIQREQDLALEEELNAIDAEARLALDAKDIEDLRAQILTKRQIKEAATKEQIAGQIKQRNTFLKDEQKHGTAVATLNRVLNSDHVKNASTAASELIQLQGSKNKTLKAIGKRAAQAQIAIDTARGAISAYTSLAGIPYVGPFLGIAAAAAVVAYGASRVAQVNSAQRGGVVPSAGGGSRDRVPMMLEPNELVVPKALAPDFIQSVGRPDAQAEESTDQRGSTVEIAIEDDATDFITAKQRENTDLAIGVA